MSRFPARRLVLFSAALPGLALAQEPAAPTDPNEIVVTARFRNESIQDVPIAITALKGDALAQKNLNNLQDIAAIVPTVDFRAGASNKDRTVFIRGVGTITTSPGVEPSVSTVVDGVVLTRPGQSTLDLVDIDRIEVLRGPQGTLFGKNASAGVINIVSKTPTNDFHLSAQASYFEGDEYRFRAGASGAIIEDKLLFSVTGLIAGFDGNVKNLVTGNDVNGYKRRGGRAKLVAKPSETVTLTFNADYLWGRDDVPTGVFASTDRVAYPTGAVATNPTLAAILAAEGVTPSLNNRTVASSFDSDVRDKNYGGSVQADIEIGDATLTSITAYREWKNAQHQDWDSFSLLTAPGITGTLTQGEDRGRVNSSQISQELRFTSAKGGLIDYVVGLYFLKAKTDEVYRRDITRLINGATVNNSGIAHYGIESDNFAAYGEANVNFTPSFRAIVGGRVIQDELQFYHNRVSDAPAAGVPGIAASISNTGSTSKTDYTARLGLQYDLASDAQVYATYSRGYKGQAYNVFFNMPQNAVEPLAPETSNSYEVGFKASALENRLQASIAAYITKFSGYQTNFQDSFQGALVTRLTNAGDVSSRGVEGDFTFRPIDPLNIGFNFAYTDAKIDKFNCPANATCTNFDGQPLPYAPKWKLHGDVTYTVALGDTLGLELNTDYSYKSKTQYSITQTPDTVQPGYGIWNASIALVGDRDGHRWSLRGIVKNIADKHYSTFLAYGAVAGLSRFVPRDNDRYFGVTGSVDF
ncbi:TonB-dependent receptor [Sphingobium sp.]|uniref:TonB-dependent receptor n=1 Tax=Sphingobium sp. TaxID=1912891 RepID=UPI002C09013C|nr:TonB-dependent receptor [Sphingobium sp.]HUD91706.1 TonB-dependent receptor [Sphingobium sp.]